MGLLKVIVVAYNRSIPLRILIDSFKVQSDSRWELHIVHDGPTPEAVVDIFNIYANDPQITFYRTTKRSGKYGHPNRRIMLDKIKFEDNDFILLTNDDNYYVPSFVKYIQSAMQPGTGMIYYDMLHNYYSYSLLETKPKINYIDMGAFIVRATIAQKVGFMSDNYEADGIYCEACVGECTRQNLVVKKIKGVLFVHN